MYFQTRHGNRLMWTNLFHAFSAPLTKNDSLLPTRLAYPESLTSSNQKRFFLDVSYLHLLLWYARQTVNYK